MIRALRAIGLIAVHCDVQDSLIKVGILLADPNTFEPGQFTLIDADKDEEEVFSAYSIICPDLNSPISYNVELKRENQNATHSN